MNKNSWSMKTKLPSVTAQLVENQFLRTLQDAFPRHPKQVNKFLESDAEILRDLPKPNGFTILKTDAILEEIRTGLYRDPFTIGWMAVTATISDVATVGATPDGILLQLQVPKNADADFLGRIYDGINAACTEYGVYVVGGDTNFSNETCVGSTCIGHFEGIWPLSRIGCKAGDLIYTTGKPGAGSLFAFNTLFQGKNLRFRPVARVKESRVISKFATSCIDSSDGFIPALANLGELNSIGFSLDIPVEDIITEEALAACEYFAIPSWLMLAGPHGDYELVFTIPPERQLNFLTAAADSGWAPTYTGTISSAPGLEFLYQGRNLHTDPSAVANLFSESDGDIQVYLQSLLQHHRSLL
jgi:thiamine-monophosphate kinase